MKVKALIATIGLGALATGLAATNPNEEQYSAFASEILQNEAQAAFCQADALDGWLGELGNVLGNICETAIEQGTLIGEADLQNFIADNTQRQNFWLFSLYTTQIPAVRVRTLGIFNRFVPIQQTVEQGS